MKIELVNGLVTLTMSEKDARAFSIVIQCAVDNQDTLDADALGVTQEEMTLAINLCETMNDAYKAWGFHDLATDDGGVAALDVDEPDTTEQKPWWAVWDYSDDDKFNAYKFTDGDRNVVNNLRQRWKDTLVYLDDKTLAYVYLHFGYTELHGDNDARFLEYLGAEPPQE